MNAIYLHAIDGFTFLENVPEKPYVCDHKGNLDACANERCWDLQECQDETEYYERALAEAIQNRLVIGNPEQIERLIGKKTVGELYPWPGTWDNKYQYHSSKKHYSDAGWVYCTEDQYKSIKSIPDSMTRIVVILSPPKEEKKPKVFTTFPPEDSEEKENESKKFSTLNSGFSIESKVCEKCGSVLKWEFHKGLRIQKVEPVNSSMSEKEEKPDSLTSNQYRFRTTTSDEQWEPLVFVNAFPDAGYPKRILEAHLQNCEGEWVSDSPVAKVMNDAQKERKEILQKAIRNLGEPVVSQDQEELWLDVLDDLETGYSDKVKSRIIEELKKKFTITRNP